MERIYFYSCLLLASYCLLPTIMSKLTDCNQSSYVTLAYLLFVDMMFVVLFYNNLEESLVILTSFHYFTFNLLLVVYI